MRTIKLFAGFARGGKRDSAAGFRFSEGAPPLFRQPAEIQVPHAGCVASQRVRPVADIACARDAVARQDPK